MREGEEEIIARDKQVLNKEIASMSVIMSETETVSGTEPKRVIKKQTPNKEPKLLS